MGDGVLVVGWDPVNQAFDDLTYLAGQTVGKAAAVLAFLPLAAVAQTRAGR